MCLRCKIVCLKHEDMCNTMFIFVPDLHEDLKQTNKKPETTIIR